MPENVVSSTADAVLRLVSEFTPKKILGVVLFVFLIFCCLLIFDRVTATFSLKRIDKSISILERLNKLDLSTSPDLLLIKAKLIKELDSTVDPKPLTDDLLFPFSGSFCHRIKLALYDSEIWSRTLTGMAPWILVALCSIKNLNKVPHIGKGILLTLFIGFFFGLLGLTLPSIGWLDYFLYPMGQLLIVCLIGISISKRKATNTIAQQ